MRPSVFLGWPCAVSRFQVVPASVLRYKPLPGPPQSMPQGERRACQSEAKITFGLEGSSDRSMPPEFSSLYKTLVHVFPPSVVRKTPRSALGPKVWPKAATYAMSGFLGCTAILPIARVSRRPAKFQVLPASMDL